MNRQTEPLTLEEQEHVRTIQLSGHASNVMSFMSMLPQISIPSIEDKGMDDPTTARRFADRLKCRIAEMQKELEHDEQLEVVAFLPSGAAVRVDSLGYQSPALLTLKGQDQATGKACAILVHQSSLQILVSIERVPPGQTQSMIIFDRY